MIIVHLINSKWSSTFGNCPNQTLKGSSFSSFRVIQIIYYKTSVLNHSINLLPKHTHHVTLGSRVQWRLRCMQIIPLLTAPEKNLIRVSVNLFLSVLNLSHPFSFNVFLTLQVSFSNYVQKS